MCGRYTLTQVGPRLVGERFELGEAEIEPATLGRFNVCPTEDILVVTHKGPRAVRWGLVPSYSRKIYGPLMINARAESVTSKKVFARLLERPERRCLVIADGWYEWLKSEKKGEPRVPFRYTIDGGELFAFAGLCDVAKIDGEWVPSATILTTTANSISAPVHDRMPVVLGGPDEAVEKLEEVRRAGSRIYADSYLSQAYFYRGDTARAFGLLDSLAASSSGPAVARARSATASFAAARGERERAERLIRQVLEAGYVDHHVAYSLGVAYAQLGRMVDADRWLERAVTDGFPCYPWYVRDPLLAPFRAHQTSREFLARLRARWEAAKARYA